MVAENATWRVNPELKMKIAPIVQAAYGISKLVRKANL